MMTEIQQQLNLWESCEQDVKINRGSVNHQFMLPDADIEFDEAFLDEASSDRYFEQLLTETPWQQDYIHLYNKQIPLPRLTAWYGDRDTPYCYSGIVMQAHPWTTTLLTIKTQVEARTNLYFNSVLLNLYRDGKDSVAWHSDDEAELGQNPAISSVSFGAIRRFSLKHKRRKDLLPLHFDLPHGSLLLMKGATQHHWLHQVPKTKKPVDKRINLTFRLIM